MSVPVSIIIPCFNEGNRFPNMAVALCKSLVNISPHLALHFCVADDGSALWHKEVTARAVQQAALHFEAPHTIEMRSFEKNRGKGAVLRELFQEFRLSHAYIGFFDADGATAPDEMIRILNLLIARPELDSVIGCRLKALGYFVDRSTKRHISGRIFATLLSTILKIPVYDSQCGAKLFRSKIISDSLLSLCDNQNWLFDTQLVVTLYHMRAALLEVPISWHDAPGSKVSLLKDAYRMASGICEFRPRLRTFLIENKIPNPFQDQSVL